MQDEGRSVREIVALAREAGEDEEGYWHGVELLARRVDPESVAGVFGLTRGDAFERGFAASIFGQVSFQEEFAFPGVTSQLLEMLEAETDDRAISALLAALGRCPEEPRIFKAISSYAHYPDSMVRWHVARRAGDYLDEEAVELLIELMDDEDPLVRDWATFTLGHRAEADSPHIRAALVARLGDEDPATRQEAFYGLASRKDPRVVEAVLREFDEDGGSQFWAESDTSPSYELLPALRLMVEDESYEGDRTLLQTAIDVCEAYLASEDMTDE